MRCTFFCVALSIALLFSIKSSHADNTEMMRLRAQELIEINADVLKEITKIPVNGRITVQANVVERDGHVSVRIEELTIIPTEDKAETDPTKPDDDPNTPLAVRGAYSNPILESSVEASKAETNDADIKIHDIATDILKSGTKARAYSLSGKEMSRLNLPAGSRPVKAVVIYWED